MVTGILTVLGGEVLPKFNSEFAPEKLLGPNREGSFSNHQLRGCMCFCLIIVVYVYAVVKIDGWPLPKGGDL